MYIVQPKKQNRLYLCNICQSHVTLGLLLTVYNIGKYNVLW